jgi:2'-5' RNA ligase
MPRLFTGLEIPATVGEQLAMLRGGLPGARWVEPENYHITLRFIGDIEEGTARDLYAALGESRPRASFPVTLDAIESFGGGKPRAVFARVKATNELSEVQAEQERLLRRVGLAPEKRRFTPHVTLARLNHGTASDVADYIATHGHMPKLTFTANRFVLYSARESTGGGPYVVEAAYPFA